MRETLCKIKSELKQPYFCALLLLACVPILPEYFSFVLVIAAAALAGKDLAQNKRKWRIGTIGKLLIVYCSYQTLSTIYSTHRVSTFFISVMWWLFLLAYLTVANLLTDRRRIERFLMCITAAAGIVGLIACVQYRINYFIDRNVGNTWLWLDNIIFKALEEFGIEIFYLDYKLRAFSTFSNPNMLAQFLVMATPFVACYNFMEQRSNRMRLFSRTCLFLSFAGVLFSFSRGGYLAIAILAVALVILNIRRRFTEVFLYIVSAVLFLPAEVVNRMFTIKKGISDSSAISNGLMSSTTNINGGTTLPPSASTTEIINQAGAESAVGERWEIWMESIKQIFDRPLFGHGAGTQTTFQIFDAINIQAPHAHNIILQLLLEGGIIALAIMGVMAVFVVRNGIRMMRGNDSAAFWMGFSVMSFGVCFMAHGMVDYPLMAPRLICFFIMVLGIIDQTVNVYAPTDGYSRKRLLRRRSCNTE